MRINKGVPAQFDVLSKNIYYYFTFVLVCSADMSKSFIIFAVLSKEEIR